MIRMMHIMPDSMRQITFEVRSPASILALMLSPIDHPGPEVMRKKEGM